MEVDLESLSLQSLPSVEPTPVPVTSSHHRHARSKASLPIETHFSLDSTQHEHQRQRSLLPGTFHIRLPSFSLPPVALEFEGSPASDSFDALTCMDLTSAASPLPLEYQYLQFQYQGASSTDTENDSPMSDAAMETTSGVSSTSSSPTLHPAVTVAPASPSKVVLASVISSPTGTPFSTPAKASVVHASYATTEGSSHATNSAEKRSPPTTNDAHLSPTLSAVTSTSSAASSRSSSSRRNKQPPMTKSFVDLPLVRSGSLVCIIRHGAATEDKQPVNGLLCMREVQTKLLDALPQYRNRTEQSSRSSVRQEMEKLHYAPIAANVEEIGLLKSKGIIKNNAPGTSLYSVRQVARFLSYHNLHDQAKILQSGFQEWVDAHDCAWSESCVSETEATAAEVLKNKPVPTRGKKKSTGAGGASKPKAQAKKKRSNRTRIIPPSDSDEDEEEDEELAENVSAAARAAKREAHVRQLDNILLSNQAQGHDENQDEADDEVHSIGARPTASAPKVTPPSYARSHVGSRSRTSVAAAGGSDLTVKKEHVSSASGSSDQDGGDEREENENEDVETQLLSSNQSVLASQPPVSSTMATEGSGRNGNLVGYRRRRTDSTRFSRTQLWLETTTTTPQTLAPEGASTTSTGAPASARVRGWHARTHSMLSPGILYNNNLVSPPLVSPSIGFGLAATSPAAAAAVSSLRSHRREGSLVPSGLSLEFESAQMRETRLWSESQYQSLAPAPLPPASNHAIKLLMSPLSRQASASAGTGGLGLTLGSGRSLMSPLTVSGSFGSGGGAMSPFPGGGAFSTGAAAALEPTSGEFGLLLGSFSPAATTTTPAASYKRARAAPPSPSRSTPAATTTAALAPTAPTPTVMPLATSHVSDILVRMHHIASSPPVPMAD